MENTMLQYQEMIDNFNNKLYHDYISGRKTTENVDRDFGDTHLRRPKH